MGRPPHIQTQETFTQFFESIPEEARHRGYWSIKHETFGKSGGLVQANLGKIEVEVNENYDSLKERVKDRFAVKRGPGTYYATATDEKGKEMKAIGQARFEFSEKEIPMPEPPVDPGVPVRDAMQMAKKLAKDQLDMQSMEYSQKLLEKFMGSKKEEDVDKTIPQASSLNDMMLWKMLMDDGTKKKEPDAAVQQQLADLKLEQTVSAKVDKAVGEIKTLLAQRPDDRYEKLMEKLVELQKPREDSDIKRLLEQLIATKQENPFQHMMALMVKQQEDRERSRMEDERRRDAERMELEKRRLEDERRRDSERVEEHRRLEAEKKEEAKQHESRLALERQKFESEIKEQQRRFDADISLRREEIKSDQAKAKDQAVEQQRFQLQLLDLFKNNKDSNLESISKVVDAVVGAGMNSMKTAQDAAETIMQVAKDAAPHKEKKEGNFLDNIKDIAQIAAPIIGPIVDADSKMKVLQAASRMAGGAMGPGLAGLMGGMPGAATPKKAPSKADAEAALAAIAAAASQVTASQAAAAAPVAAPAPTTTPSTSVPTTPVGGAFGMIAQYLKAYPILRYALLGNIKDNLGVKAFLPVVTGLNQPTLEGLMANVPARVVMDEVKMTCNEEEAKLVDANEAWFVQFRKEMIAILKEEEEEEEEETPASPGAK